MQRPILEVGDIVVVDNLAAHHGEVERAQRSFLNDLGMELVFLPVCSPDLNTVQEVFSKPKYLSKYTYQEPVWDNLEYAVLRAFGDVTAAEKGQLLQARGIFFFERQNCNLKQIQ